MAKLYVISDVHGFYDEMMIALNEAGFDPNDKDSWLISLGDHFDRGPDCENVMNYLMGLERKILISGNHEGLFTDCIKRGYPYGYDISNGTVSAIEQLGSWSYEDDKSFEQCCAIAEAKARPFLDSMVNYFETENYIFVHSFVPLKCNDDYPMYYTKNRKFEVNPDWRNASQDEWDDAKWGNPFDLARKGLLPNKTLVFGHWHVSWARHHFNGKPEWGDQADFSPYYGDGYIGLDACTAYSGKVNCLVIEDNFL